MAKIPQIWSHCWLAPSRLDHSLTGHEILQFGPNFSPSLSSTRMDGSASEWSILYLGTSGQCFCLRPKAKDLGITWVVVVLVVVSVLDVAVLVVVVSVLVVSVLVVSVLVVSVLVVAVLVVVSVLDVVVSVLVVSVLDVVILEIKWPFPGIFLSFQRLTAVKCCLQNYAIYSCTLRP